MPWPSPSRSSVIYPYVMFPICARSVYDAFREPGPRFWIFGGTFSFVAQTSLDPFHLAGEFPSFLALVNSTLFSRYPPLPPWDFYFQKTLSHPRVALSHRFLYAVSMPLYLYVSMSLDPTLFSRLLVCWLCILYLGLFHFPQLSSYLPL